jgi:hypothetical protein
MVLGRRAALCRAGCVGATPRSAAVHVIVDLQVSATRKLPELLFAGQAALASVPQKSGPHGSFGVSRPAFHEKRSSGRTPPTAMSSVVCFFLRHGWTRTPGWISFWPLRRDLDDADTDTDRRLPSRGSRLSCRGIITRRFPWTGALLVLLILIINTSHTLAFLLVTFKACGHWHHV